MIPADYVSSLNNQRFISRRGPTCPWNAHEPRKGVWLSGRLDLERFIQTAQSLGLYMIARPSPFICAEWELVDYQPGSEEDSWIRSSDPAFIEAVDRYYDRLLIFLVDTYQVDQVVQSHDGKWVRLLWRRIRIIFVPFGIWWRKRRDPSSLYIRWTMASNAKNEPWSKKTSCDGKLRFQQPITLVRWWILSEYGKKWPLMYGILGWLVYLLEGTPDSKDPEELVRPRGLELGSHKSLYVSWRDQFWLHEWLLSSGTLDLLQVTSYD